MRPRDTRVLIDKRKLDAFIRALARAWSRPVDVYLLGGSFMVVRGLRQSSMDIDFGFRLGSGDEDEFCEIVHRLGKRLRVDIDFAADPTRWGMLNFPHWKKRAAPYARVAKVNIHAFHPVDVLLSKVARGTREDWEDIRAILDAYRPTEEALDRRYGEVFAASPPSDAKFFFKQRYKQFKSDFL